MFRKILTIAIFSVFVLCSIPFFLGLAVSHTFFSRTFYTGTLLNTAYNPLVDAASKGVVESDPVFQKYFSPEEVRQLLRTHFTKDLLKVVIDDSSSRFSQDISSVSDDLVRSEKLKMTVDFTPFQKPTILFISELAQRVLDRLPLCAANTQPDITGIFPSCSLASWQTSDFKKEFKDAFQKKYQQKIFTSAIGSGKDVFVRDLVFDVPLRDAVFALHQFEMIDIYVVFFVVAFICLMLLLWFRNIYSGLTLSSLMLVCASVLGLIIAMILSKIVSLLPSDVLADPSVSASTFALARDLLSIILISFAKVYATILSIVMLISGAIYIYVHRYLKKS